MFQITELQLDVLRALWARGRATSAEVTEDLRRARDLAPTTVSTLLKRLEKRGLVRHERDGRRHVYEPRVTEAEVKSAVIETLTNGVFGGDVGALVGHLLSGRDMSAGDLARVREILERTDPDRGDTR